MITLQSIFALALATMMLGFSPGPAVFATIGRALHTGLKATYLFIAGIIAGDVLFSLLAMMGLSTLAALYTPAFMILKIIGGGYLIYLGVCALRHSQHLELARTFPEKGWRLVLSGFLLTASNPKDLLFFVGFLPLFMDLKTAGTLDMFVAAATIALSFTFTLSFYALLSNRVRLWFKSDNTLKYLHCVAGLLMILVGGSVILF